MSDKDDTGTPDEPPQAQEKQALEEVQKDAAKEREQEGGYQ